MSPTSPQETVDASAVSAASGDELCVSYDETAELVNVTWSGGVHLVTFETHSTLDGRIEFR
ncbi:MAG: hypothetical protein M8840_12025 [marine benthic group bacterium]|jgi:hypothetical protein|nr:hypothetical protein [Candidatus Benthicola marisminoris]MCL7981923.1 hypothetical protein [Gemmatimonadota bacterium]MCL7991845.1 hypothetical protein [Gemmatimonadota bacterium]